MQMDYMLMSLNSHFQILQGFSSMNYFHHLGEICDPTYKTKDQFSKRLKAQTTRKEIPAKSLTDIQA